MKVKELSTSEKVLAALKSRGSSKVWLAEQLEISYPTLYSRLEHNDWTVIEISFLQKILNID